MPCGPYPAILGRTARISIKLMCISLYDVNSSDWTAKPSGFAVKSKQVVEPSGIEPLTS
jgi:hypothetical protein